MSENTVDSAIDFLRKVKAEKTVKIKFKKQDGTDRIMNCTLDFSLIPDELKPKSVDLAQILKLIKKNEILRVFDIEKQEWRSVPFDRLQWLETPAKIRYYSARIV